MNYSKFYSFNESARIENRNMKKRKHRKKKPRHNVIHTVGLLEGKLINFVVVVVAVYSISFLFAIVL